MVDGHSPENVRGSADLYFRVLGPMVVERAGEPVAVGGPQHRCVLALLLLHANQVVSVDQFVEALWGEDPPGSSRVQLRGLVSQLRRTLGTEGAPAGAPIETRAPGYRLPISPDCLDLEEFRRDVTAARDRIVDGDPSSAADLLRVALARWRGPAFTDIPHPVVQAAAAALEETRLRATEDRIEAEITIGGYQDLIPELRRLTAEHPLRERFLAQLMTALASTGRPADALAVFREARQRLAEELGIEPSAQLQRLHRAILAGELGGDGGAGVDVARAPRQLPADVRGLVGRDELLEATADLLRPDESRSIPPCLTVTGPRGVGKTAFAVHLAHRVREAFPDGQLYAGLGGPGRGRIAPECVLTRFLRTLGVPPGGVPAGLDERSSLFRELLATRRVLVVLDDVADDAQLRPLLPAGSDCAVIATSYRRLAGTENLWPVPLDVLSEGAGVELLRTLAGGARVDAEADAAVEVVRHCGRLPLAIRIAGARLASRPNWSVGHLARRLAANRDRLDWLQLGDIGVRTSIAEAYAALAEDRQRLFRRLGLLTTPEFPAWLPAALLDHRPGAAERLLDDLVDVHLVEPAEQGITGPRYRMHDLVHLLAGEFAAEEDPSVRRAALGRALHGWRDLAATADAEIPHWYGLDPEPAPEWRAPAEVHDAVRADHLGWFDEEADNLADLVRQAAGEGYPQVAWPLAQRVTMYLDLRGRYDDWADVLGHGLRAAEAAGDRAGVACMLGLLVDVEANRDRFAAGMRYAERAFAAYLELGDEPVETRVRPRAAAPTDAREPSPELAGRESALTQARRKGDPLAIGLAAHTLALSRRYAGVHGDYLALFEEARVAFRSCGAQLSELWALKNAGLTYLKRRRFDQAAECLLRAQSIVQELGGSVNVAFSAGDIPLVYAAQGRFDEAEGLAQEVLEQARLHRHPWGAGKALDTLGELRGARGDHRAALDAYLEALTVWRRVHATSRIRHTVRALADLCDEVGDTEAAALYRAELSTLLEETGDP